MRRFLAFLLAGIALAWAGAAPAADRAVTLSVPTMNCPLCPITVRKALSRVEGVSRAEVSYQKKETTVTFDDARTSVDALRRATAEAGYPSEVRE
jgi:mercuric ion binding protein